MKAGIAETFRMNHSAQAQGSSTGAEFRRTSRPSIGFVAPFLSYEPSSTKG